MTKDEARDFLTDNGKNWQLVIFFSLFDEIAALRKLLEEKEEEEEYF